MVPLSVRALCVRACVRALKPLFGEFVAPGETGDAGASGGTSAPDAALGRILAPGHPAATVASPQVRPRALWRPWRPPVNAWVSHRRVKRRGPHLEKFALRGELLPQRFRRLWWPARCAHALGRFPGPRQRHEQVTLQRCTRPHRLGGARFAMWRSPGPPAVTFGSAPHTLGSNGCSPARLHTRPCADVGCLGVEDAGDRPPPCLFSGGWAALVKFFAARVLKKKPHI